MITSKTLGRAIDDSASGNWRASAVPNEEQTPLLGKHVQKPIFPQDIYTVAEVSRLLGISAKQVRRLSTMRDNPLPVRKPTDGLAKSFILRDELLEWLKRCSVRPQESRFRIRELLHRFMRVIHMLLRILIVARRALDFLSPFF